MAACANVYQLQNPLRVAEQNRINTTAVLDAAASAAQQQARGIAIGNEINTLNRLVMPSLISRIMRDTVGAATLAGTAAGVGYGLWYVVYGQSHNNNGSPRTHDNDDNPANVWEYGSFKDGDGNVHGNGWKITSGPNAGYSYPQAQR